MLPAAGADDEARQDEATGSPEDDRVSELIADDGSLATTELVMMEVMAGAKTDGRKEDLRRLLLRFHLLPSMRQRTSMQRCASTACAGEPESRRDA